ncbi:sigma 54-interacting transcriptional regulator [Pseudobacillus sp. FSL P4-0506]|uniref:sigma-54 interaction domain-containing protein n=1 Tax=Pseudobacillus sp. FSL P4-0506 TaxID=2921576 RepID=UPI0030FB0005
MSHLRAIQHTVQEIAEAITAAIGMEVEIIDEKLRIVAGTGRYEEKVGQMEEEGNLDSGYIYSHILKKGTEYIVEDAQSNPFYHAVENELAEVCCPIKLDRQIVGLIGMVAFAKEQQMVMLHNKDNLLVFLRRMADLLSSKIAESKISDELKIIVETSRDGIVVVDKQGVITLCNHSAEQLINMNRDKLIGQHLHTVWPDSPVLTALQTGEGYADREEFYKGKSSKSKAMHFFTTVNLIFNRTEEDGKQVTGAVVYFRDIADVRKMVYEITENKEYYSFQEILGTSNKVKELKRQAKKIAPSNSTVLITGASGTGKGLLAKAIHYASPRKNKSLIMVNCAAIPDTLLESELFGYEGGAFTGANKSGKVGKFELAHEGTIFLDEIGDMSLHLQVKLLHVLQHREIERVGGTRVLPVDVRVIAATNRDLEQMMQDGEFREDLYFRLNVIPIKIPSLFERKEDIPLLLHHALQKYNDLIGKQIRGFEQEAMELLVSYQWPGNIRELENAVEYAVNIETNDLISKQSIPGRILRSHKGLESTSLKKQLEAYEKQIITKHLQENGYSVQDKRKVAAMLGISESTLYRRIRELGIVK